MMPSSLILHHTDARDSGRLSTGNAHLHVGSADWPAAPSPIRSRNPQSARLGAHAHPFFDVKGPRPSSRSILPSRYAAAKSP